MIKAIIYFIILAVIYGVLYYFNHKTPKPEGCENLRSSCEGCNITSCMAHPNNDRLFKEENKNA